MIINYIISVNLSSQLKKLELVVFSGICCYFKFVGEKECGVSGSAAVLFRRSLSNYRSNDF